MLRIGTDIIEIRRIADNMKNRRFVERIYHPEELASLGSHILAQSLAARFAAKEAVIKALKQPAPFRDILIFREPSGAPRLELRGKAQMIAEEQGLSQWEVTLSHCKEYTVAFVAAQKL